MHMILALEINKSFNHLTPIPTTERERRKNRMRSKSTSFWVEGFRENDYQLMKNKSIKYPGGYGDICIFNKTILQA